MLVTKNNYTIFAVVKTTNQKKILINSLCSPKAILSELNGEDEIHDKKNFVVNNSTSFNKVEVITLKANLKLLDGVQFFDEITSANEKKIEFFREYKEADVISIQLYTS